MKLFTFGDSWTEGVGGNLKEEYTTDIPEERTKIRYKYAWPTLLSKHLNIPFDNFGIGGCSNKSIFDAVCNSIDTDLIKKDDLVVIMWSSSLRDYAAFLPRQQWVSWSVKHLLNKPEKFIESYKSNDGIYDSFLKEYKSFFLENLFNQNYYNIVNQNYIIFLQKLLEFYEIKYIMSDAFDKMVETKKLNLDDNYLHLINKNLYWKFGEKTFRDYLEETNTDCFEDTNEPGKHPNAFGYNLISQEFYNYIVKNKVI